VLPRFQPEGGYAGAPPVDVGGSHRRGGARREGRRRGELLGGELGSLRRRNVGQQRLEGRRRRVESHRWGQQSGGTSVVAGRRGEVPGEDVGRIAEGEGVEGFPQAERQVEGVGQGRGDDGGGWTAASGGQVGVVRVALRAHFFLLAPFSPPVLEPHLQKNQTN
jgi:hypothetical protein